MAKPLSHSCFCGPVPTRLRSSRVCSGLLDALGWDAALLPLVPVPLGHLVEGHADALSNPHRVLVTPLVVLLKLSHKHLHLILALAHAFALNGFLNV